MNGRDDVVGGVGLPRSADRKQDLAMKSDWAKVSEMTLAELLYFILIGDAVGAETAAA